MCGLIGAFRTENSNWEAKKIKNFMNNGLLVSMLRGESGTGVGLAFEDGVTFSDKSYLNAKDFLDTDRYLLLEDNFLKSMAIIGHTRSPTIAGSVSSKNAQPFEYFHKGDETDWYMLTHNGHVNNAFNLTPVGFSHQVDSAHVAWLFASEGPKAILPKLKGSYVLVWYHRKTKTVNIAKNEGGGRGLSIAFAKDGKAIYYASEKEMLASLLVRNGIEIDGKVREVPPFVHYTWSLEGKTLQNFTKRPYEEEKPYTHSYAGMGAGSGGYGSTQTPVMGRQGMSAMPNTHQELPFSGAWIWSEPVRDAKGHDFQEFFRDGMATGFGYVYARRPAWPGTLVKIMTIKKEEWEDKWSKLKRLPLRLVRDARKEKDTTSGEFYPYIEGNLFKEEAQREYNSLLVSGEIQPTLPKVPPAEEETSDEHATMELVQGPGGELVPIEEWRRIASAGCYNCNAEITEKDVGKIKFVELPLNPEDTPEDQDYDPLCPECSTNQAVLSVLQVAA